jgi:hypothetical protein
MKLIIRKTFSTILDVRRWVTHDIPKQSLDAMMWDEIQLSLTFKK